MGRSSRRSRTEQADETPATTTPEAPATAPTTTAPVAAPAARPALTKEEIAVLVQQAHDAVIARVPLTRPCGCGCGAQAKGRFLPGHDAKLHSAILAELRAAALAAKTA